MALKASAMFIYRLYQGTEAPVVPCNSRVPSDDVRNAEICRQYANGKPISDIARTFGISVQRIHQIIRKLSPTPAKPRLPMIERNRVIRERFKAGEAVSIIATIFHLTERRVYQIVNETTHE
jgi:Mor family transcriptional regulator